MLFKVLIHLLTCFALQSVAASDDTAKALKVGVEIDFAPYSQIDEAGKPAGYAVDLIKAVGEILGQKVEIRSGLWNDLKEDFRKGEIDLLPLMAITEERQQYALFSAPHIVVHDGVFIRKEDTSKIKTEKDLEERTILVMEGDTAHEEIRAWGKAKKIQTTSTMSQALKLLSSGQADAVIGSMVIGLLSLKKYGISNISHLPEPISFYSRQFSVAVKKDQADLLDSINDALAIIQADGIYARIYKKHFSNLDPFTRHERKMVRTLTYLASFLALFALLGLGFITFLRHKVKSATQALREALQGEMAVREKLQRAYEAWQAGQWSWDITTNIIELDKRGQELMGVSYAQTSLSIQQLKKTVSEQDWSRVENVIFSCVEGLDKEINIQHKIRRRNETRWVWVVGQCRRQPDGQVNLFEGWVVDITQEKEKSEAAERFRNIVEQANVMFLVADVVTGKFTDVNQTACEQLGYTSEELMELRVQDIEKQLKFTDDNEWEEHVEELRQSGGFTYGQGVHRRKDGSEFPVEVSLAIRTLENSEYILAVARDISERLKLEKQLEAEHLRAVQSEKLASLGEMAASISHEVNNPLAIIGGVTDRLLTKFDQPEDPERLEHIKPQLVKIRQMVDRVSQITQAVSRLARGSTYGELETEDLSALIQEALIMSQERIHQEQVQVFYEPIEENSFSALASPAEALQIFTNLIRNSIDAVKESPQRWIQINTQKNGDWIEVHITDSGNGIPSQLQEKVFEPFFTTKAVGQGTGLGLSLSRSLMEQMNGELIYAPLNDKTRFICRFRAASEDSFAKAS